MSDLTYGMALFIFMIVQHGSEYNSAVPRKLSESFGIDVSGASAVTSKQVDTIT